MIYDVRRVLRRLRSRAREAGAELPAAPVIDALRAALSADDFRYAATPGYRQPRLRHEAVRLVRRVMHHRQPPREAFEPLAAAYTRLPEHFEPSIRHALAAFGAAALGEADAPHAAVRAWWLHRLDPHGGWAHRAHAILETDLRPTADLPALLRVALVSAELYCPTALRQVEEHCKRRARADRLPDAADCPSTAWAASLLLDYMSRQTRDGRYVTAAWRYGRAAETASAPPAPLSGLWLALLTDCLRTARPSPPARPLSRGD